MAKPSFVRVSESHAACASEACAAVTVRFANGLVRSGSKSLYPLWSAKRPSLWRKSNSRKIRGFLPDVPSNRPCCRDCWSVSVVVTDSTDFDANFPAHDLLLSLLRMGWLSASEGCGLRQPADSSGAARCGGVAGCVKKTRKRHAVRKMKVGPSEPPCRGRLQTAVSCFSQKLWW